MCSSDLIEAYTLMHDGIQIFRLVCASGLGIAIGNPVDRLIGGLSTGFVLAIFMANAGGAWDNAKKYVEEGNFGEMCIRDR